MKGLLKQAFDAIKYKRLKPEAWAFSAAIDKGDVRKVEMFLKKFPDCISWKLYPHDYTSIHAAARARQFDLIPLLQRHGADIDAPCAEGYPPLLLAQRKGEVAKMVAMGAKLHDARWTGLTPLMQATIYACSLQAEDLIDAGTDLSIRDSKGWTALMYASKFHSHWHADYEVNYEQAEVADYILKKIRVPEDELRTCLALAKEDPEWGSAQKTAGLLQAELDKREQERQQAHIASCNDGTPQKTVVMKPLKLSQKML
ncbi:MAG: ankyrin repeat domain-containing protein [Alphaproteobacteria bacterium]